MSKCNNHYIELSLLVIPIYLRSNNELSLRIFCILLFITNKIFVFVTLFVSI